MKKLLTTAKFVLFVVICDRIVVNLTMAIVIFAICLFQFLQVAIMILTLLWHTIAFQTRIVSSFIKKNSFQKGEFRWFSKFETISNLELVIY